MKFEYIRNHLCISSCLVVVTVAVYAQVLGHEFLINWDDNIYVTGNSSVHGLSLENLRTAFTNFYAGNYAPVQMLSYMLDYSLWGLWPGGFLLTNMLLHVLNGILLYVILYKSHADKILATVGAAIFLLHPVQVESVAWISQRKNLLAMFFMLLSWVSYIRYRNFESTRGHLDYFISLVAFACSLFSKSVSVFFPLALLSYDHLFLRKAKKTSLFEILPYLALSIAVSLITMQSQSQDVTGLSGVDFGGRRSWNGGSYWVTLLTMLPVFCSYLKNIVLPYNLNALYSPLIRTSLDLTALVATAIMTVISYSILILWRHERRFGYWPGFAVLAILPVSQIIPLITLMNDRYLYFPMIGVSALAGVAASYFRKWLDRRVLMVIIAILLVFISIISFQRVAVWESSKTLWSDVVRKQPDKFEGWEGLGEAYHLSTPASLPEADLAYSRAFSIYSSGVNNIFNLAKVKILQGDTQKGIVLLRKLLRLSPQYVMGWVELGDIYLMQKQYQDAEICYKEAERFQPEAPEINFKLFNFYLTIKDSLRANYYAERVELLGGNPANLKPRGTY